MAKKSPVKSNSSYVSEDIMSKLTKITLDNIKEFFENKTLFIVLIKEGSEKIGFKYSISNQFNTRSRFIANKNIIYSYIFDNKIVLNNVLIKTEELLEDYIDSMNSTKSLIKKHISNDQLYGIKI